MAAMQTCSASVGSHWQAASLVARRSLVGSHACRAGLPWHGQVAAGSSARRPGFRLPGQPDSKTKIHLECRNLAQLPCGYCALFKPIPLRSAMSEEIDKHVLKRYDVGQKLGKGAYGIVWKSIDKKSQKLVALKKVYDAFQVCTRV